MGTRKRSWLERSDKVELFEQIRREYEFGTGTIQGVARQFGVHRRLVREALTHALPAPARRSPRRRWRLGPAVPLIEQMLAADRSAPPKQRHTAHRIWQRLTAELPGFAASERTVREYVHERKRALGLTGRDTCVPQCYATGQEAQADWYEAVAELGGERVTLQVFCLRSMGSGAAFHRAYRHATQQAFLDAHEHAFHWFGGVFATLRYDNLKSAVRQVLRGKRREETTRFVAFRSHWRFRSEFCSPGAGNEKGGVEGEVGRFRRQHWVPVPSARDLDELNTRLVACAEADLARRREGHEQSVGAALLAERPHLLPLAAERFALAETSWPVVDGLGCVRVRTNRYSVPVAPGTRVEARVLAATVELWHEGRCVARHERCFRRQQQVLDLEHYLAALVRRPGALAGSAPLAQWRAAGRWPACFDVLWQELVTRHGRQEGTRAMIGLLSEGQRQGWDRLRAAVEQALALGTRDAAAVRHLLEAERLNRPPAALLDIGHLARYERPQPGLGDYDQLLVGGRQA